MQLSAEITNQEISISTNCLVVFTHPEAKTKEELLDCFMFNLPEQKHASGLIGSVPIGDSPEKFTWDDNEKDPKKILRYIDQFFGERKNRKELKKKRLFTILFEQLSAKIQIKCNKDKKSQLPTSITIDHMEILRFSHGLFRTNAQGVGKYFTTHDELESAIIREIKTNIPENTSNSDGLTEYMIKLI